MGCALERTRGSSGSCHGDPRRRRRIRLSRARARRAGGRLLQCQGRRQSDRVAAGCSCKPNAAVIPRSCVSRTTRRRGRCTPIVMRSARKTSGTPVPCQRPAPGVSAVECRRLSPTGIHRRRATRDCFRRSGGAQRASASGNPITPVAGALLSPCHERVARSYRALSSRRTVSRSKRASSSWRTIMPTCFWLRFCLP